MKQLLVIYKSRFFCFIYNSNANFQISRFGIWEPADTIQEPADTIQEPADTICKRKIQLKSNNRNIFFHRLELFL